MNPAARVTLEHGLHAIGLEAAGPRIDRLVSYHDLLMLRNAEFNLTGHDDEAESIIKNVLNALAPWRHLDPAAETCDIGTGAGFPGLPLAIMLGMEHLSLVESKAKKCRFLEEAAHGLPGVTVVNADANTLRRPCTQAVACGFGTLAKFADVTRLAMPRGTRLLAWKGKRDVIDAEIAATRGIAWTVEPFIVPGLDAERHLCVGVRK